MKDRDDRVLIEGFYDKVRTPGEIEKEALSNIPYDEKAILADLEIPAIAGSRDYGCYEKLLMRPTLTIDGFQSGFTGRGIKTIVPSEGMVKLEARLVPDQDPDEVIEAIRHHLAKNGFSHINENLRLDFYLNGIKTTAALMQRAGE